MKKQFASFLLFFCLFYSATIWAQSTVIQGGGASGLTIGTTTILSGTDTRCLFDDNGVVGEDAGCTYTKATDKLTLAGSLVVASTGNTPTATTINWGTAGTGLYSNGTNDFSIATAGSLKLNIDNTLVYFVLDVVPASASSRSLGTTALPWNDVQYTGWAKQTAGKIALNADYTNATATFSSTALSINVTSGRTYNGTLVLFFSDSTAADGAQFDFNGGAATVTNFRSQCAAVNAAGANLVLTNGATTSIATAVQVALALTTQTKIVCDFSFVPSSTSTFIIRAAQTAHSTGTLTVNRGSWLSMDDARPL